MKADTLAEFAFVYYLLRVGSRLAVFVLSCFVAGLGAKDAAADAKAWAALQQGDAFVLMRHGSAERRNDPRTFSPGDCARERNLSDQGRREAVRIGEAFRRRGITVATVLASPYCRTIDTARLAFGTVTSWEPLALSIAVPEKTAETRFQAVKRRIRQGGGSGNVVMVTHRPNIKGLTMKSLAAGELVVVTMKEDGGGLVVIGHITLAEVQ